jgi:hypothetical protein
LSDDEQPPDIVQDGLFPRPTGESLADSAADPAGIAKKFRKIDKERLEAIHWWHQALSTERGRRIVWKLLEDGKCFETTFACGPNGFPQPEATWFHAGAHAYARRLYDTLMLYDRAAVFLMHDENDPRFKRPK